MHARAGKRASGGATTTVLADVRVVGKKLGGEGKISPQKGKMPSPVAGGGSNPNPSAAVAGMESCGER